jgi:hypothetical protein
MGSALHLRGVVGVRGREILKTMASGDLRGTDCLIGGRFYNSLVNIWHSPSQYHLSRGHGFFFNAYIKWAIFEACYALEMVISINILRQGPSVKVSGLCSVHENQLSRSESCFFREPQYCLTVPSQFCGQKTWTLWCQTSRSELAWAIS